jgi:hypothetical protein
MRNSFIGLWAPSTAGERLAHFLAGNVESVSGLELRQGRQISSVPRGRAFGEFLEGCVVLHLFGRLIQVAKHLRMSHLDSPEKATARLEAFAIEILGISRGSCLNFDSLALLALEAAESSSKASATPNRGIKRAVLEKCRSVFFCYSCGTQLNPTAKEFLEDPTRSESRVRNDEYLTYDHLWPHSLGGDSIETNILPACHFCNNAKQHIASWELALIQSVLPKVEFGSTELDGDYITREIKLALHMRAALSYARTNGTSLKDAYIAIGPRSKTILILDPEDTPDFFNLCSHDLSRTGLIWG